MRIILYYSMALHYTEGNDNLSPTIGILIASTDTLPSAQANRISQRLGECVIVHTPERVF